MAQDIGSITHGATTFFFQSKRAGVNGLSSKHLVDTIRQPVQYRLARRKAS